MKNQNSIKPTLKKLFIATGLIFVFNSVLTAIWYSMLFGKLWMETVINGNGTVQNISMMTILFEIFIDFIIAFVVAHIFTMYTNMTLLSKSASNIKVLFFSIIRLPILLSVFYFALSCGNVIFGVYTLTHLFIESGYVLISLLVSCLIVVRLFKGHLINQV